MSSPANTFQCYRCAGFFRAAAASSTRVKCPHCAWVAGATEFRLVRDDEVGSAGQAAGTPAQASVEIGGGAWVQKGKFMQFGCPHCERPMRMRTEEVGGLADCPHCGLEIISPDPESGTAARLSDASARNMGSGGRVGLKPRGFREKAPEVPLDEAPSLEEADQSLAAADEMLGTGAGTGTDSLSDGGANPFSASALGEAANAPPEGPIRHRGVRMLGVEELGAAFQAKEDLEAPDPISWDNGDLATKEDKVFNDRRGKWFGIVAGVVLAVLGSMFVVLEFKRRGESTQSAQASAAAAQAERETVEARFDRAFEVARSATGAKSWREVLPFVRARERVAPLMASYYEDRTFIPVELVERGAVVEHSPGGIPYLQLTCRDGEGSERLAGLEEAADGSFRFDWELWVDIAARQWEDFLSQRPTAPRALRVTLARTSPLARYVADAGLESADEARAIRVWLKDSGAALYAVFPKSDPAMNEIWDSLDWERGRRVVAELAYAEDAKERDRVSISKVVQVRWVMP